MKAIVNVPVCGLYGQMSLESTLIDEDIYGSVVDILEQSDNGWCRIRTHYRYEGYVPMDALLTDEETVASWSAMARKVVLNKNFCDVLSEPKVQGWIKISLPRGARIRTLGEPEKGWQEVLLADGRTGYVPSGILGDYYDAPLSSDETVLRKALVDAAMRYQGTHYRWGGKTPGGIDCSGLCSMAYMLCGILIYRDADIREGFPLHPIPLEQIKPGDLLFFPGHVAMYMGDGLFCHSTAKSGCDGFVINSLNPGDANYREDLHKTITQIGSYF